MDDTHKGEFGMILQGVAESFRQPLSEAGFKVYWLALRDLDFEAFQTAIGQLVTNGKFMPTIAEIREAAGFDTVDTRAMKAWSLVSACAGNIGSYRSVCFEDGTINAVIRNMGGWIELLGRTGEDFDKWARQEFIRCYKAFDGRCEGMSQQCCALGGLQTTDEAPYFISVGYEVPKNALIEPTNMPRLKSITRQLQELESNGSEPVQNVGDRLPVQASRFAN